MTRYNEEFVPITCYLDAFSGISGDMLVGALADAGADQAAIIDAIASLDAGASVSFEKVKRCGIGATKYHVAGTGNQDATATFPHIVKMIEKAPICRARPNATPSRSSASSGRRRPQVHQVPIEKVHFHEVGAADSIADIVGACVALDLLDVETVVCSPLNVGSGTVKTEHGLLPVPAPATARLLDGEPVYARGPAMELTTPTGAAVAVTLATRFGVLPPMKITAHGLRRRRPRFPGARQRAARHPRRADRRRRSARRLRHRSQYRRPQPAGAGLCHRAAAGIRRARRHPAAHRR